MGCWSISAAWLRSTLWRGGTVKCESNWVPLAMPVLIYIAVESPVRV